MICDDSSGSPRAASAGMGDAGPDGEAVLRPHLPRLLRHCGGLREQARFARVCGSWRAVAVGQKIDLFDPAAAKNHFEAAVTARKSQPGALRAALARFSRGLPPFVAVRLSVETSQQWEQETTALQELGTRADRCVSLALFVNFGEEIALPIWNDWAQLRTLTFGAQVGFVGVDLSPLQSLTSLTCLRLERVAFPPIRPPSPGLFLPALTSLRIRSCTRSLGTWGTDFFPEEMLQHLRQLEVSRSTCIPVYKIYPRLTELRVQDCHEWEIGHDSLQGSLFPQLRILSLYRCHSMKNFPRVLPLLSNLRELDIRQTGIEVDTSQLSIALQQRLSGLEIFRYDAERLRSDASCSVQ